MESGASCKTALKWIGFHVLLFKPIFHFSLMFFELAISCRSTILANAGITPKKLLEEQIHRRSLKKFTALIIKKNVVGSFWLLRRLSIAI